jgi:hypothetical protein
MLVQRNFFSQNQFKFCLKYSSFLFNDLKKQLFQKFFHWMLKKEKTEEQVVRTVHVKVLKLRRMEKATANCVCLQLSHLSSQEACELI